jgi:protein associated with RNAse G/E
MIRYLLFIAFLVSTAGNLSAQHLAAYLDYRDRFNIFDRGETREIENYKIMSFKVGGNCVAYISYGNDLKIYHRGSVRTLEHNPPSEYTVTDHLMGYSMHSVLKVFDDGELKILCNRANGYIVEDSLITWYDEVQQILNVYHNGITRTIEDGLLQWPIRSYASGDNILAYITEFDSKFKIYYRGEVLTVDDNVRETVYKAGRDIVGFMNHATNAFMVFYKGKYFDLEAFAPRSFQMGDEMMAYVNSQGDFKLFENGELVTISTFEPESYMLVDSTLVFVEDGFLKTWCNGRVYEIERYVPPVYKVSERTIAYLDNNNRIKAFRRCEPLHISYEMVNSLDMIRNLIIYNIGVNTVKIWYNGKVY